MTMTLHMLKMSPDMRRLAHWAARRGLASADGDLGYALHAALTAVYGDLAPRPFRLYDERTNGRRGSNGALYGYTSADASALCGRAAVCAEPEVAAALDVEHLATKAMPTAWSAGRRLGFEVRIRPVVRQDCDGDRARARERDAFQVAFDRAEAAAREGQETLVPPRREGIYADWLGERLARGGAARLVGNDIRLVSFQRVRVIRRGRARLDGRRPIAASEGPDAVLAGLLEITDGAAFADLLRRGIGRHRAFGFGMLLLRPAGAAPPC